MTQAIGDRIASWQGKEILDLWEEMRQLTIRIVGEALLGTDPNQASVGKHFEAIEKYIVDLFQIPLVLPMWIPIPQNRQLAAAQQALYPLIDELVTERKKEPKGDLLTMLISTGMTNQQIRDEVITLLFAGHQTTAATLNWIWYLLTKYPQVEEQLHSEVDATLQGPATVADLPNLPYTRMLIDETLRLWPPAFFTNRWVKQDDQIGPYRIRKGSIVFLSMYTIHRHPSYWNDPEAFDPQRFSSEAARMRPHYTYIPFGGGQHRCLGESFAKTELCLAVASIAKRYQLQIDPAHQIVIEPTPALRPNHLYMRLRERK
jgi:cytochrome P450